RRKMCRQMLGGAARLEIAILIRESNHPISIRDVQKLRVVARWIKSDPERFVQTFCCKKFSDVRLAIAVAIAQHLDLIGATLYDEDVAIRCAEKESWIAKSSREQFDFEPRRNFGLRVRWPVYNARAINCESIRAGWRQILHPDFARDARRIARPITHRGFAGEDRAFFCRLGDYVGDDENTCKKDNAENWIAQSTSFH